MTSETRFLVGPLFISWNITTLSTRLTTHVTCVICNGWSYYYIRVRSIESKAVEYIKFVSKIYSKRVVKTLYACVSLSKYESRVIGNVKTKKKITNTSKKIWNRKNVDHGVATIVHATAVGGRAARVVSTVSVATCQHIPELTTSLEWTDRQVRFGANDQGIYIMTPLYHWFQEWATGWGNSAVSGGLHFTVLWWRQCCRCWRHIGSDSQSDCLFSLLIRAINFWIAIGNFWIAIGNFWIAIGNLSIAIVDSITTYWLRRPFNNYNRVDLHNVKKFEIDLKKKIPLVVVH